jgi:hypothetical protein
MNCGDFWKWLKNLGNVTMVGDDAGCRIGVLMAGTRNEVHRKWFSGADLEEAVKNARLHLDKAA